MTDATATFIAYVDPWLPEPLFTAPDVAEDVELADSVSMAMLLVMETLTPTERAVFVLREVFGLDYDEIAEAVDKTPIAVRQHALLRPVVGAGKVARLLTGGWGRATAQWSTEVVQVNGGPGLLVRIDAGGRLGVGAAAG